MRIVVMGGAGRVGSGLVTILSARGAEVVSASRRNGVDAFTGAGLAAALAGADVVVDVMNAPSFEDDAVGFFETSTRNLLAAEAAAGVRRHVALSIVGAERLCANGYFRAKLAQERQVEAAAIPHTILRATQFFEFLGAVVDASAQGDGVRLAPARVQPIAAEDVSIALSTIAVAETADAIVEVAGPDSYRLDRIVAAFMAATGDRRAVVTDAAAPYFGTVLNDETLMAGSVVRFGHTDFDAWLGRRARQHPPADAPPARPPIFTPSSLST